MTGMSRLSDMWSGLQRSDQPDKFLEQSPKYTIPAIAGLLGANWLGGVGAGGSSGSATAGGSSAASSSMAPAVAQMAQALGSAPPQPQPQPQPYRSSLKSGPQAEQRYATLAALLGNPNAPPQTY